MPDDIRSRQDQAILDTHRSVLTGHPRVGASVPREKWRRADGTMHWRDKF